MKRAASKGSAKNDGSSSRLSSRFRSMAIILLVLGGMSLWHTSELMHSFIINFDRDTLTLRQESYNITVANDSWIVQAYDSWAKVAYNTTLSLSEAQKDNAPFLIPEALQNVTVEECCGPEANSYYQVCLTERACANNTLYPFTSLKQKSMFTQWLPTPEIKGKLRNRCNQANAQLTPPTTWCGNSKIPVNTFPMGCSLFSMAGRSGPYDRALVFPKGKLAFCGIPKVGITQWLQFLRFTLGAKDYQSMPYYKWDAQYFYLDRLQPNVRESIWNNNTWRKAILIRDPAERLLSAYLDKIFSTDSKNPGRKPFGVNVTFADFVYILAMNNVTKGINKTHGAMTGLTWYSDPHWRPQAWSCGLSEDLPKFDYIGTLDSAAQHTKAILQKVNMWESYGKHYQVSERGKTKGSASCTWPPEASNSQSSVGFQQQGTNDNDRHNQASKSKLDKYYTPELMKKVREIYWMDFQLWDALKEAEKEGLVHGRDVARKLNPECK